MGHTAHPPAPRQEERAGVSAVPRRRGVRVAALSAALLLGVGGFTLFALWESLKPPAGPVRAGGLHVQLVTAPHPARVGANQVEVNVRQGDEPVGDARVELRYILDPMVGANPMQVADTEAVGGGRYRGQVEFARAGPWQLTVLVKRPGRPDVEAQYPFNLAPDPAAVIGGQVRLGPGLGARPGQGAALFIFARRGPGPPVAARRIADPRFPVAFTLSQSDAMAGGAFEGELEVVARLKMDGQAGPLGPGDAEVKTPAPVRVGTRDLVLVLDRAP